MFDLRFLCAKTCCKLLDFAVILVYFVTSQNGVTSFCPCY